MKHLRGKEKSILRANGDLKTNSKLRVNDKLKANDKLKNICKVLVNKIVSALIIIAMTMANFIMLGANMVTYAADVVEGDSKTSHDNIRFSAYLTDSSGNMSDKIEENINSENLKLHFKIEVLKEGYFNGQVILSNSNFKLKSEILSEGIHEIKDNTIFLC